MRESLNSKQPLGAPATHRDGAPRVAIIGCGAIAESFYLPALSRFPEVLRKLVLVDSHEARAKKLASDIGTTNYLCDYRQAIGQVDAAIVAVPPHLHSRIALDFLASGAHVLCEKPLAQSVDDAAEMVRQAGEYGVTLSVNNTRRLFPASIKVKELLADGTIGNPTSVEYTEGKEFSWPTISGFYFNSGASTRGVLLDKGSHVLDLICWWLGGKPSIVSSENDSFGGCEAVASVKFRYGDCSGEARFSWLGKLPNRYVIKGELGTIEGDIYEWDAVTVVSQSGKAKRIRLKSEEKLYSDFGARLVANLVDVVKTGARPMVPASDVLPSIEWIDECYAQASRFDMPWCETLEVLSER